MEHVNGSEEAEPNDFGEASNENKLLFFDEITEDSDQRTNISIQSSQSSIGVSVCSCCKEGNDWVYTIKVSINGTERVIKRTYGDIEQLHNLLTCHLDLDGNIIPPIPAHPIFFKDLPSIHLAGPQGEAMFGPAMRRLCLPVETSLQIFASSQYFADNHIVHSFLSKQEYIPSQERLGARVFLSDVSKMYSERQLTSVQDLDEELGKTTQYVVTSTPLLRTAGKECGEMIISWQKLASQQEAVRSALQEVSAVDRRLSSPVGSVMAVMAEALMVDAVSATLASLDHERFLEAKNMLYRRLAKLQAFLQATRQLDKSKGNKKQAAQEATDVAHLAYKTITTTARKEIKVFQQQHYSALKTMLEQLTESQIAHSKSNLQQLEALRNTLKNC